MVNFAVSAPDSEFLAHEPKQYAEETPYCCQNHVRHDWINVTVLLRPRRNELRKAVAPYIFIHGDADEDGPCYGFV